MTPAKPTRGFIGNGGGSYLRSEAVVGNARNESRDLSSCAGNFSFCSSSNSANAHFLAWQSGDQAVNALPRLAILVFFFFNIERSSINLATLAFSFKQADCTEIEERDARNKHDLHDRLSTSGNPCFTLQNPINDFLAIKMARCISPFSGEINTS